MPIAGIGGIPATCDDRRYKAGRCKEHWLDWRNACDARRVEGLEWRKKAKPNRRGRISPPSIGIDPPGLTADYARKEPKTPGDFARIDRAAAKRARRAAKHSPATPEKAAVQDSELVELDGRKS